jgi:hypothetical protein
MKRFRQAHARQPDFTAGMRPARLTNTHAKNEKLIYTTEQNTRNRQAEKPPARTKITKPDFSTRLFFKDREPKNRPGCDQPRRPNKTYN